MNHVDIFSGIAGFAYAAKQIWRKAYHNVCFCDNNKFCQEVIKKNFGKDSLIYGDIKEVTRKRVIADTGSKKQRGLSGCRRKKVSEVGSSGFGTNTNTPSKRLCNEANQQEVEEKRGDELHAQQSRNIQIDLLTGGFPCQPFSAAGKRRGKEDDRYLWPEMFRVIKEFRPTWIIGENVAGIIGMAERQGNVKVGSETDLFGNKKITHSEYGRGILYGIIQDLEQIGYSVQAFVIPACTVNAPHRRDRVWIIAYRKISKCNRNRAKQKGTQTGFTNQNNDVGNASKKRLQRVCNGSQQDSIQDVKRRYWECNWIEVATELCGVDDGLPAELDGFKLSKAGHRIERLKALGNAIVPQVAMEIMRAIKQIEEIKCIK